MGLQVCRIDGEGASIAFQRFLMTLYGIQNDTEVVVSFRIVGIDGDCPSIACNRIFVAPDIVQRGAEIDVRLDVVGILLERFAHEPDRVRVSSLLLSDDAQQMHRINVFGVDIEDGFVTPFGFNQIPLAVARVPLVQRLRNRKCCRNQLLVLFHGLDERFPAEQTSTQPSLEIPEVTKEQNVTTTTRAVGVKRPRSRVVVVPRSFLNAGTKVLRGERKFLDYAFPPTHVALDVVSNTGGRVGWHNSPLPGPFFPQ